MDYLTTVKEGYTNTLKNKLFGLLCEYERGREWEKFLDSIIIELLGASEEQKTVGYYVLVAKLSSCRFLEYKYFRTTVLECMGIFDKL